MAHESSQPAGRLTFGARVTFPSFDNTDTLDGIVLNPNEGAGLVVLASWHIPQQRHEIHTRARHEVTPVILPLTPAEIENQQLRDKIDNLHTLHRNQANTIKRQREEIAELLNRLDDATKQERTGSFDMAQLGQAGLELHSREYMRALEAKARTADELSLILATKNEELPEWAARMVLAIHEACDNFPLPSGGYSWDIEARKEGEHRLALIQTLCDALLPHGRPVTAKPEAPAIPLAAE